MNELIKSSIPYILCGMLLAWIANEQRSTAFYQQYISDHPLEEKETNVIGFSTE